MNDTKLQNAIDALEYPKVTEESIAAKIEAISYIVLPNSTVTICNIKLHNGFSVRGESACIDPRNFDADIGQELAYKNAFGKLWKLEGYLLAEKLHGAKHNE